MTEPSSRWDYHLEPNPVVPSERLNALGAAGWELIAIENRDELIYVFRRATQSFVERVTMEQRRHVFESLGLDPEIGE